MTTFYQKVQNTYWVFKTLLGPDNDEKKYLIRVISNYYDLKYQKRVNNK